MNSNNVIQLTEKLGSYEYKVFLILSLPAVSWSFFKMGGIFLEARPDFRCLLPHESPENTIYQLSRNMTNKTHSSDYEPKNWLRCGRYDLDFADADTLGENFSSTSPIVKCDSFVYDKSQYTMTVTTEWDLVCDNAWLRTVGDSLFMFADCPGVLIFGAVSDKYGRKPALLLGSLIQLVCGVLLAASPEFIVFTILRVTIGLTMIGVYVVAYVFAIEMVNQKNRMVVGISLHLAYIMGYILISGLAYFITNWRILQIVFMIPSLAYVVFSRHICESVWWLETKTRPQEMKDITQKQSLKNDAELLPDTIDAFLSENCESKLVIEQTSVFDILRYSTLRKKTLLLFYVWIVVALSYYGLSWNTSNLGGNDYLNCLIAAAIELPAVAIIFFTLNRWGRKIISCGATILAGLSLLLTFFVPDEVLWLRILLVMIGKSATTASFAILYIFSAEQYPTEIRNLIIAAYSSSARLSGVVAPYIEYLFGVTAYLPFIVLGFLTLLGGLFLILLPETLNRKLPESLQEAEEFGRNTNETERDIMKLTSGKKKLKSATIRIDCSN